MQYVRDELNRLIFETWQIYQLMRILVFIISNNNEFQKSKDDLFYSLVLAQVIENRLEPISKRLDALWADVCYK